MKDVEWNKRKLARKLASEEVVDGDEINKVFMGQDMPPEMTEDEIYDYLRDEWVLY